MVPPSVLLSVQGDFMRMWGPGDQLKSVEGSAGFALLDKTVLLDVLLRWESYTRRSNARPAVWHAWRRPISSSGWPPPPSSSSHFW